MSSGAPLACSSLQFFFVSIRLKLLNKVYKILYLAHARKNFGFPVVMPKRSHPFRTDNKFLTNTGKLRKQQ